ncbi:fatty acyl-CoA reductase wat-like [Coccinella septempunctata]|uniref:fatty acyl-CoA reductase wat-like n=1 Tax=Coccinella septempunctata TaxID=41139 RepID=UPI001D0702E6|nr:fatty acyl-CoA reductase wat-like [Coccinella septempunctata]XP_044763242.1 fatty acyl-CoA reductase wat-like [Coccinella septempunctata]
MEIQDAIAKDQELTPIQSFYKDANILITGGTGFLGCLLLEKLLRSCTDISTIYLLVRSKKGKDLETRVDELFEDLVFDKMKKANPKFRHKVVPIEGDCCLPQVGLKDQDVQMLIDKVNIVFHVAATVRFDEKLKNATTINVKASLYIVEMARKMKNLKCFMHISTAYTNCVQPLIQEKIYPPPLEYEELIKIADNVPENLLCDMTEQIIGEWPNTYAFTKAVAEDVIAKKGRGMPTAIFRPSIIISTYREPIPAWINNIYGPTGIAAAAGTGILRTLHCDHTLNGNMIPVDMCVNSLIAVAWEVGTNYQKDKDKAIEQEVPVYHYESSTDRPITWGYFMKLNGKYGQQYPTIRAMWFYCLTLWKNVYMYQLTKFFFHLIPALLIDLFFLIIRRKPMMLKIYKKIHKFSAVLAYFTTRNFKFQSNRVKNMLDNNMTATDKQIFFCDLRELDWEKFFQVYLKGLRIYLLQDDLSSLDRALVMWGRFRILHWTLKTVCALLFLRILWYLVSVLCGIMFT